MGKARFAQSPVYHGEGAFSVGGDNLISTAMPDKPIEGHSDDLFFSASNSNALYKGSTLQLNALRLLAIIKS